MIYFLVGAFLLFLSFRYDYCGKTKGRNQLYLVLLVVLVLIVGLRWRVGADTTRYLFDFYTDTPSLKDLSLDDLMIGSSPLWQLLMSFVYTIGGKFYWVQLIESSLVNILFFKYIKKHCQQIFTCVFFYYISLYFSLNTEAMRAAIGIAVCLYANDYMLDRKWIKAFLLIAIGFLFHPQVGVVALTPLFLSLRISRVSLFIMVLSFFVAYAIQITIGDYLDILENMDNEDIGNKLASYGGNSLYIENRGLGWQIVNQYPLILYSIVGGYFFKSRLPDKLQKLQPFFIMGIIYQIMSLQVFIIYRFAETYKIYTYFYISYAFVELAKSNRFLTKQIAVFRASIIIFPLIISLSYFNMISKYSVRYFPYTSIFNRKIIKKRELHIHTESMNNNSDANIRQY